FGFFFQAEDGIRDFHVTGVQTCALPILVGSGVLHATLFQYVESPVRVFGARLGWEGGDTSSLWARFDARFGGFGISWLAFMGLEIGRASCREGEWWRVVGRVVRNDGERW